MFFFKEIRDYMHPNLVMCFLKLSVIQSIYVYLNASTCSTLKKKVKNKTYVKASMCEAYTIKEISTFISYYSEPYMRKKINCIPIHDDGGELLSNENLSIFSHFG
jgi:hypothetical protein